jgi:hypothetical protein
MLSGTSSESESPYFVLMFLFQVKRCSEENVCLAQDSNHTGNTVYVSHKY